MSEIWASGKREEKEEDDEIDLPWSLFLGIGSHDSAVNY